MNRLKDFGTPPLEASENLRSLGIDKRTLRKTGRIHQFNTAVSQEFLSKLKQIAYQERLKYVEVLEQALDCYEKQLKDQDQLQTAVQGINNSMKKMKQFEQEYYGRNRKKC